MKESHNINRKFSYPPPPKGMLWDVAGEGSSDWGNTRVCSYWKHYRAQTHEADIQIIPRSSRTQRPFLLEKVEVFTTFQIQIHHSSKKEAKNKQINTKTIQLSCLLASKLNQCKHPKWTALFVGESGDFRRTDDCDILYIWQMPHLMQYFL